MALTTRNFLSINKNLKLLSRNINNITLQINALAYNMPYLGFKIY